MTGGRLSRLMVARFNHAPKDSFQTVKVLENTRPRFDNYQVREEKDPFRDSSQLDLFDYDQESDI